MTNLAQSLKKVWFQIFLFTSLTIALFVVDQHPEKFIAYPLIRKTITFLFVWITVWAVSRVLTLVKETGFLRGKVTESMRGVFFTIARVMIYTLGLLVALDTIGVSITPLIASLGVGSVAIALALQDTLGNLFSGIYLYIDRPLSPGDFIRLENGQEGQVTRIGWRSTHMLLGSNNTVIIPNSKLSSAIVTNYSLPKGSLSVMVKVGVSYSADLDKIEEVLLSVASEVIDQSAYADRSERPVVRFRDFLDSSIETAVFVRARGFSEQFALKHEMVKAIKRRFDAEGIEIPFPQRVVQSRPAEVSAQD